MQSARPHTKSKELRNLRNSVKECPRYCRIHMNIGYILDIVIQWGYKQTNKQTKPPQKNKTKQKTKSYCG